MKVLCLTFILVFIAGAVMAERSPEQVKKILDKLNNIEQKVHKLASDTLASDSELVTNYFADVRARGAKQCDYKFWETVAAQTPDSMECDSL